MFDRWGNGSFVRRARSLPGSCLSGPDKAKQFVEMMPGVGQVLPRFISPQKDAVSGGATHFVL
jgi:hypothetical protein